MHPFLKFSQIGEKSMVLREFPFENLLKTVYNIDGENASRFIKIVKNQEF